MNKNDIIRTRFMNHFRTTILISLIFLILFTTTGLAASPQIKLTTNRYIILDDPNSGYSSVTANADTASGFAKPGSWNSDQWQGESTTIRGVALVLNENGTPASGVQVTFSVLDWNDAIPRSILKSDTNNKVNNSNTYGLATASFNLNSEQQYGRWKIRATATVNGTQVSSISNFIYNWWGCQNCHGSPYTNGGSTEGYTGKSQPVRIYDAYSPYITGRDFHATMYTDHHLPTGSDLVEGECWACHNSYDRDLHLGQERHDNGASYTGKGTPSTYGVHANLACAECHSIIGNSQSGSQTVKSCDASGCHQGATDFNSHLQQETVTATSPNKYVNYSAQDLNPGLRSYSNANPTAATFISNPLTGARSHTSAAVQNLPCTLCHGPMHNITKPDIRTTPKNTVTEDSQCTVCHTTMKHSNSNPVNCTACHSQDAHRIKILGTDGTYKDKGSAGAITSALSDCRTCHNSGAADNFLGNLTVLDNQAYSKNFDPAGKYLNQHPTADCTNSCHDTSNFHNISKGAGGPDCLGCHNSTGSALHRVDGNAITTGMHANLNFAAAANGVPAENKKCWGCHQSNGVQPVKSMGDIYNAPYKCNDCHLSSGQNPGGYGALLVDEHRPAGTDIKVQPGKTDLEACIQCHNKSEMKVNFVSPDNIDTNYSLVSHYGKKRVDLHQVTNETNCAYCHKLNSTFDNTFLNINNNRITHDNGQSCLTCHRQKGSTSGRIHDASLLGGGGPDCISCHDNTGSAIHRVNVTAINSGMHANLNSGATVNGVSLENKKCWGCHQSDGTQPSGMGNRYNNPYTCLDCHGTGAKPPQALNALTASEHFKSGTNIKAVTNAVNDLTSCLTCHNKTQMKVSYTEIDSLWTASSLPSHYGNKRTDIRIVSNESNCAYCHQNQTGEFSDVFVKPTNTRITHNGSKNCYQCHREAGATDGKIHDAALIGGSGGSCTMCHSATGGAPDVGSNDLGGHINLNTTDGGQNNLTDSDCMTCHHSNPHSGTDASNTYYCINCHNKTTGSNVIQPQSTSLLFNDNRHGAITCINCHVADGRYHQGNPRGSVANLTYVNRNMSTINTLTTECADCHLKANLDDAPFYAPGGGTHIDPSCGNGGGCHSGSTFIAAVHTTTPLDNTNKKPNISVPTLDHSTVTQGTYVIILATVRAANTTTDKAFVDGAQYRINKSDNTQTIQPWTSMSAVDGDFYGQSDVATAVINTTNIPAGTYNIEVRGMAGGWAQNPLERYYPMNGDVSPVKSTTLTVQSQGGFITGIIKSGTSPLGGALVTASGASNYTDANGKYLLRVPPGTYTVTASKAPTHNSNTVSNIAVNAQQTTDAGIMMLDAKLTGTISGKVTN